MIDVKILIHFLVDGDLYPERDHFDDSLTSPDDTEESIEEHVHRSYDEMDNESVSDVTDSMDDQEAVMVTRAKVTFSSLFSSNEVL